MAHFEMVAEWRYHLGEHIIGTESGHGWGYIRQANAIDPSRDHSKTDPEFERQYGLTPRTEHHQIMKRDLFSYLFSGNLWAHGPCTAASIQRIQITTPKLLDFEGRVVHLERTHRDAILQKLHEYVWEQIAIYGEGPIRKRIGEIEIIALNSRPRTVFDP